MRATIEQRTDPAKRVAQQNDRPQPEPDSDVVVIRRDLTLVAEIDPHCAEDVRHLQIEDGGVGVDQPMDAVLLDELVPVVEVGAVDPASVELLQHASPPPPFPPPPPS